MQKCWLPHSLTTADDQEVRLALQISYHSKWIKCNKKIKILFKTLNNNTWLFPEMLSENEVRRKRCKTISRNATIFTNPKIPSTLSPPITTNMEQLITPIKTKLTSNAKNGPK